MDATYPFCCVYSLQARLKYMIKIFIKSVLLSIKASLFHDTTSNIVGMVVASIGTFISMLVGGWDYPLLMLLAFIVLDFATGLIAGYKNKTIQSDTMYWGIIRKVSQLVIVAIAVSIDRLMHTESFVIRLMAIYFYIGMEGISILENMVKIGVRVPDKLIDILKKIEDNETSNDKISQSVEMQLHDFTLKKKQISKNTDE